jgi:hypothetical protein
MAAGSSRCGASVERMGTIGIGHYWNAPSHRVPETRRWTKNTQQDFRRVYFVDTHGEAHTAATCRALSRTRRRHCRV